MTLEPVLVGGGIVAVTGKPVHLPTKDIGPAAPLGILEHFLELRPLVAGAGHGPVGIDLDNPEVVIPGIVLAFLDLLLNRYLPLIVRGISGIDHAVL